MQESMSKKIDYLENELNARIASFESKRSTNRNKAFAFKLITAIWGGAITIFLGVNSADEATKIFLKNIALCLSASLTTDFRGSTLAHAATHACWCRLSHHVELAIFFDTMRLPALSPCRL